MDIGKSAAKSSIGTLRRMARKILPYWIVGVVVLSFLPGPQKAWIGTSPYVPYHAVTWQHRSGHFLAFGITAILLTLGISSSPVEVRAAVWATILGITIETAQHMSGLAMFFEWWDVRDDVVGIIIGVLLTKLSVSVVEASHSSKS